MDTKHFLEEYLPVYTEKWVESLKEIENKPIAPDQLQRFSVDIIIEYVNMVQGLQLDYFPSNINGEIR